MLWLGYKALGALLLIGIGCIKALFSMGIRAPDGPNGGSCPKPEPASIVALLLRPHYMLVARNIGSSSYQHRGQGI